MISESLNYAGWLSSKRICAPAVGIDSPPPLNDALFDFQREITKWALRRGRAAIFADCGLGKTLMALEWSRIVAESTSCPVLILTPLAVAAQFVTEGAKFGVEVTHCHSGADVRPGVNVANYERLHLFDSAAFGGVVLDESSVLKDYSSATRCQLIAAFERTRFRLCCTATPAPNDHVELGNHAEFLGVMTRSEMLSMFFCHDGGETQSWRVKGHAKRDFWRWVCTWACAIRKPSDLGFSDDGFTLPGLEVLDHVIQADSATVSRTGMLFLSEARTLEEQRTARRASLSDRVALAAKIVSEEPDKPWILWCDLNDESDALTAAIPGSVEVRGSQDLDDKERRIAAFTSGASKILVSKPSICGWGMNWQHCSRVVFVGLSHSFEAWYQAIRRTYRFGQTRVVMCHVVTSEAEGAVVSNLKRKQNESAAMAESMVAEMQEMMRSEMGATTRNTTNYTPSQEMRLPSWIAQEETTCSK